MDEAWVLGKFLQISEFISKKLEQYEEEQKRVEKDKAVAVEYKDKEIIIPETILQKLKHRSLSEKIVTIAIIITAIAAIIAIIPIVQMWLHG